MMLLFAPEKCRAFSRRIAAFFCVAIGLSCVFEFSAFALDRYLLPGDQSRFFTRRLKGQKAQPVCALTDPYSVSMCVSLRTLTVPKDEVYPPINGKIGASGYNYKCDNLVLAEAYSCIKQNSKYAEDRWDSCKQPLVNFEFLSSTEGGLALPYSVLDGRPSYPKEALTGSPDFLETDQGTKVHPGDNWTIMTQKAFEARIARLVSECKAQGRSDCDAKGVELAGNVACSLEAGREMVQLTNAWQNLYARLLKLADQKPNDMAQIDMSVPDDFGKLREKYYADLKAEREKNKPKVTPLPVAVKGKDDPTAKPSKPPKPKKPGAGKAQKQETIVVSGGEVDGAEDDKNPKAQPQKPAKKPAKKKVDGADKGDVDAGPTLFVPGDPENGDGKGGKDGGKVGGNENGQNGGEVDGNPKGKAGGSKNGSDKGSKNGSDKGTDQGDPNSTEEVKNDGNNNGARTGGAKKGHDEGHGENENGNTLKKKNLDYRGPVRSQNELDYKDGAKENASGQAGNGGDGKGDMQKLVDNTKPIFTPRNYGGWGLSSREAPHCSDFMGAHNFLCLGTGLENDLVSLGKNKALIETFCEQELGKAIPAKGYECPKDQLSKVTKKAGAVVWGPMAGFNPGYADKAFENCKKINTLLQEIQKKYEDRSPKDAACQIWFTQLNGVKELPDFSQKKTIQNAYYGEAPLKNILTDMANFVEDGEKRDLGVYSVSKQAQMLYAVSANINIDNVKDPKASTDTILDSASCLNSKEKDRIRETIKKGATAMQTKEPDLQVMQDKWVNALVEAAKDFDKFQTKKDAAKRLMKEKGCRGYGTLEQDLDQDHQISMCAGIETAYADAESRFNEVANKYPLLQEKLTYTVSKDSPNYVKVSTIAKLYAHIDEEEVNTHKKELWKWLADSTLKPGEGVYYAKWAARQVLKSGLDRLKDICKDGLVDEGKRAADIYPLVEGYLSCEDINPSEDTKLKDSSAECKGRNNAAWSLCRTQSGKRIEEEREKLKQMLKMMAMAAGGAIAMVLTAGGASVLAAVVGIGLSSYSVATGIHDYVTHDSGKIERQLTTDFNAGFTDFESFTEGMDKAGGPSLGGTIFWATLDVVFMGLDVAAIAHVIKDGTQVAKLAKAAKEASLIEDPVSKAYFLKRLHSHGEINVKSLNGEWKVIDVVAPDEANQLRKLIDRRVRIAGEQQAKAAKVAAAKRVKGGYKTAGDAPTATGTIRSKKIKKNAPKPEQEVPVGQVKNEPTIEVNTVIVDEIHTPKRLPDDELAQAEKQYRQVKNTPAPRKPAPTGNAAADAAAQAAHAKKLRAWAEKQVEAHSKFLEACGVAHYRVVENGEPMIVIKAIPEAEGVHPMNAFANKMKNENGVSNVVYAPESTVGAGGKAAYVAEDNMLMLSDDAMHTAYTRENPMADPTNKTAHEADHAFTNQGARNGEPSGFYGSVRAAPGTKLPSVGNIADDGYHEIMAFDEMNTFWKDVKRTATALLNEFKKAIGEMNPQKLWDSLAHSLKYAEIAAKRSLKAAEELLSKITKNPEAVEFFETSKGQVFARITVEGKTGAYTLEIPLAGSKGLKDVANLGILEKQLEWTRQVAKDRLLLIERAQGLAVAAAGQPLETQLAMIKAIEQISEEGAVLLPWQKGYKPLTLEDSVKLAENAYQKNKAAAKALVPKGYKGDPIDMQTKISIADEEYGQVAKNAPDAGPAPKKPGAANNGAGAGADVPKAAAVKPEPVELPKTEFPKGSRNEGLNVTDETTVLYVENGQTHVTSVKKIYKDPQTKAISVELDNGKMMSLDELDGAILQTPVLKDRHLRTTHTWKSVGKNPTEVASATIEGSGGVKITIDNSTTIALADGRIVGVKRIKVAENGKIGVETHSGEILTEKELDTAFFESKGADGKPAIGFGSKHVDGEPIPLTVKKGSKPPKDVKVDDEVILLTNPKPKAAVADDIPYESYEVIPNAKTTAKDAPKTKPAPIRAKRATKATLAPGKASKKPDWKAVIGEGEYKKLKSVEMPDGNKYKLGEEIPLKDGTKGKIKEIRRNEESGRTAILLDDGRLIDLGELELDGSMMKRAYRLLDSFDTGDGKTVKPGDTITLADGSTGTIMQIRKHKTQDIVVFEVAGDNGRFKRVLANAPEPNKPVKPNTPDGSVPKNPEVHNEKTVIGPQTVDDFGVPIKKDLDEIPLPGGNGKNVLKVGDKIDFSPWAKKVKVERIEQKEGGAVFIHFSTGTNVKIKIRYEDLTNPNAFKPISQADIGQEIMLIGGKKVKIKSLDDNSGIVILEDAAGNQYKYHADDFFRIGKGDKPKLVEIRTLDDIDDMNQITITTRKVDMGNPDMATHTSVTKRAPDPNAPAATPDAPNGGGTVNTKVLEDPNFKIKDSDIVETPRGHRSDMPTGKKWKEKFGDRELDEAWFGKTSNGDEASVGDLVTTADGKRSRIVYMRRDPQTGVAWAELKNGDVVDLSTVEVKLPPSGVIGQDDVGRVVWIQGGGQKTIKAVDKKRGVLIFEDGTEMATKNVQRLGESRNPPLVELVPPPKPVEVPKPSAKRVKLNDDLTGRGYPKDKVELLSDEKALQLQKLDDQIKSSRATAKELRKAGRTADAEAVENWATLVESRGRKLLEGPCL